MNLVLQRLFVVDGATLGVLEAGELPCFTLEDEPRNVKIGDVKIDGETCIPSGTYELKLRRFGAMFERYRERYSWNEPGMLELVDVPGFTDVLIHCGNGPKDTRGCVLVGHGAFTYGTISESLEAYHELYKQVSAALLAGERCSIEVRGIGQ